MEGPPDTPAYRYGQRRRRVVEWLGQEWLRAHPHHRVSRALARETRVTTCEIALLGAGLHLADDLGAPATVQDWARRLKEDDPRNQSGAIWELLTMLLLHNPPLAHASPRPPNEPGYDLRLKLESGWTLRVSCKVVTKSPREVASEQLAARVHKALADRQAGLPVQLQIHGSEFETEVPLDRLLGSLDSMLRVALAFRAEPFTVRVGKFEVTADLLNSTMGYPFEPGRSSFSLLVTLPYHRNERRRLGDTLEKALSLFDHRLRKRAELDLIAVQVPPGMDFDLAREWSAFELGGQNPHLAGVLLYRPHVDFAPDDRLTLFHDYRWLANPAAAAAWTEASGGRQMTMGLPAGVAASRNASQVLSYRGSARELKHRYWQLSGEHHYRIDAGDPMRSFHLRFQRHIDTTYWMNPPHIILGKGPHLRPRAPGFGNLVVLNAS